MSIVISKQFGADNGELLIYFHGAPGSPDECKFFDKTAKNHALTFLCVDRFAIDASIKGDDYFQLIAAEILKQANGKSVVMFGFSIGAFAALQTCRYLGDNVKSLHLISAAAPLEAGDFLNTMAGKRVFQLAQKVPILFRLLSHWQRLLARFFPATLFQLLFASAVGEDKILAAKFEFQACLTEMLKNCFAKRLDGYVREIQLYVQPWEKSLSEITTNTYIWHGAEDNWSPPAMASYLACTLPTVKELEIMDGLSHYSCLQHAMPKIITQLSKI